MLKIDTAYTELIYNIKHLKKRATHYKELTSGEKNKIKMSIQKGKALDQKLKIDILKIKHDAKKKRTRLFECSTCGEGFKTRVRLKSHNDYFKGRKYSCGNNGRRSDYYTPEKRINELISTHRTNKGNIENDNSNANMSITVYTQIVDMVSERMCQLNYTCICCRNICVERDLRSTTCYNHHMICNGCFDDIDDIDESCPICKEDLDLQTCDICILNHPMLVDTGCGNGHSVCESCLASIKQVSSKCPFCRADI